MELSVMARYKICIEAQTFLACEARESLIGFVQLRYEPLDQATTQQYIAEIDDEVMRLGALIEDLTLLSRFDAGRAELGESEIDMSRFAASIKQRMNASAGAKSIKIVVDAPETILPVHASLNHLTVVFRNLIDNAIKYTPQAGHITWTLQAGIGGVVNIIQDTGRGIDPRHVPHLFERFYRADSAHSRETPGTGLGLSLVKSIVEAYGGKITVASTGHDKGTTITILWPYHPLS
jgi:signal transduction histidine kinase